MKILFFQHLIIKNLKHTAKLKEFHSEPPYIHLLDSAINVLALFPLSFIYLCDAF